MKAVILAGGDGTRMGDETLIKPKPMISIGGQPILWHIMKIYSAHGIKDFIICCGYKGQVIKDYFASYSSHMSDITFDLKRDTIMLHRRHREDWKVTLVDTGHNSMTGGRLLRVSDYLKDEKDFCFTYGDGVGDVNISSLIKFHHKHGKLATVTATYPPGQFGVLEIRSGYVRKFTEKQRGDGELINGGFFILNTEVLSYINCDKTVWEEESLVKLAQDEELVAFRHKGFWQPMDTPKDKKLLNHLWNSKQAPWKIW